MKDGGLVAFADDRIRAGEVPHLDAFERPAVRAAGVFEVASRFRERDVEDGLACAHARERELERERRLARARIALNQIEAAPAKPAEQEIVEPADAARYDVVLTSD
jgi:hypothetical protein